MTENTLILNNLSPIIRFLRFENEGDFYFVQVIKRKREHPTMVKSERLVNTFFIYSLEDLHEKFVDITDDCETHMARAYIWLNKRNDEKIALETLRLIAQNIANKTFKIRKSYLSICGQFNSETDKKWIVDYDKKELGDDFKELCDFINEIPPHGNKINEVIETPNGWHLITSPFDLKKFKQKYSHDVQKDNPTILYYSYTPSIRRK